MSEIIRTLGHKEQAIVKLPIYFGSYDNYHHPIRELVVNARDVLKQMDKKGVIEVYLSTDRKTITVKDNGSGIPIEGTSLNEETGEEKENWVCLFKTLFSGTKMSAGGTTGGTNGCGNTVICYTSSYMKVVSKRKGKMHSIIFENGGDILQKFKTVTLDEDQANSTGTEITVTLDDKIYTSTIFEISEIENILNKLAAVTKDTDIYFTYNGKTKLFKYNSYQDYYISNFDNSIIPEVTFTKKSYSSEYYDLDLKRNNTEHNTSNLIISCGEETKQECYLNGIYLIKSKESKIYEGVLDGLKTVFNRYAKENGLYDKKEKNISNLDISQAISFMAIIDSTNVSYTNQTKFTTDKLLYSEVVKNHILEFMEFYTIEHKDIIDKMVKRILLIKRANEKAENSRRVIKKTLEEKVTNANSRPEKFVPCRSKIPKEVELILIEGDSAMNSVKLARDSKTMCIYPLKGKPINALKKKLDDILNNNEIKDIFKILGCGMSFKGKNIKGIPHFNINNLQVDKILITVDADVDGGHILSLLIGNFYTLAPELLKQGKVYILYTPLYIITCDKQEHFIYSEEERNALIKSLKKPFVEKRFKGLGGLSVKNMSKAMSLDNRVLRQITFKDIDLCKEKIELFLSEEKASERKNFIETEGTKYFDYSILEG